MSDEKLSRELILWYAGDHGIHPADEPTHYQFSPEDIIEFTKEIIKTHERLKEGEIDYYTMRVREIRKAF